MKHQKSTLLFACCMLLLPHLHSQERIDLLTAIEEDKIQVQFESNGTSSEECVFASLSNHSKDDLIITVSPGLQLASANSTEQDILITREEEILVQSHSEEGIKLYGFCNQPFNAVPVMDSQFRANGYGGKSTIALAEHLNDHSYSPEIQQEAVWSMSELPLAGIYNEEDPNSDRLRDFCADLLGEEPPTYEVDYGDVLNTQFERQAHTFSGEFNYTITEAKRGTLTLYGPDGEEFVQYYEGMLLHPGRHTQNFEFSGTGLRPGNYRFVLYLNGEEQCEMEMII